MYNVSDVCTQYIAERDSRKEYEIRQCIYYSLPVRATAVPVPAGLIMIR